MKCPFCNHENTRVIDSRPVEDKNSIRRRRVCDECQKRFTTYEQIETIPLIVRKKDNNREAYNRKKIEDGILRACHKRPVSAAQIRDLVDEIETEIFCNEDKEVGSDTIGELIMDKLKDLDPVAYVRFASVYREGRRTGPEERQGFRQGHSPGRARERVPLRGICPLD